VPEADPEVEPETVEADAVAESIDINHNHLATLSIPPVWVPDCDSRQVSVRFRFDLTDWACAHLHG